MQFAFPAGEGQEMAHSMAVDGVLFLISHLISYFLYAHSKAFFELWRKAKNIYTTQHALKIQNATRVAAQKWRQWQKKMAKRN